MNRIRPLTVLRAFIAVISVTVAVLFGQIRNPAQGTSTERATILSIGSSGGFVPVGFDFRNSARNIVNYDGSHYRPGPITMQYPGPALYPLLQNKFSKADLAKIDKLARAAGLHTKGFDWGVPNTADVPNLTVSYRGTKHSIASFGVGEESLTAKQRSARKAVSALLAFLASTPGKVVKPTAVVMISSKTHAAPTTDSNVPVVTVDWPADSVPLASVTSCRQVTEKQGAVAAAFLAKQNELTRYRSGGVVYQVFARVYVPGDWGCGTP